MYNAQEVQNHLNQYLDLGFSPIWLRGKVANYQWKFFTLTSANMKQYLRPGINWGIRAGLLPSGVYLYFIDLDTKDLLSAALESNFDLLKSPIVVTGKGFHIYCTWKYEIKTTHDRPNKIDIISRGYVVAPPSVHASGKQYHFFRPLNGMPPLINPDSLTFTHIAGSTTTIDKSVVPLLHDRNIGAYGAEEFKPAEKGQRHTRLVSIIGIELSRSFIEENTLAICLEWNKKNKPPMTEAEVVNTVHDVYQRYDHYEEKKI